MSVAGNAAEFYRLLVDSKDSLAFEDARNRLGLSDPPPVKWVTSRSDRVERLRGEQSR